MAACGGTPQATRVSAHTDDKPRAETPRAVDRDLDTRPPPKLLSIDWSTTRVVSEADALALWKTIAPTGRDWDDRLQEVPHDFARPLAIALLRTGNFDCMAAKLKSRPACSPPVFDVDKPDPDAGLGDPCLRRLLALWSIEQLEPDDVPSVLDALRAIAAIPPPESELTASALRAIPESDSARRLELLSIMWRAGQRELANTNLGTFDEPQLIEAATKHHIDGALEVLSASAHRATYLAAVGDDQMTAKARAMAISELVAQEDKLTPDLKATLVKATAAKDCSVAAAAARALAQRGDKRYLPKRPRTKSPDVMMRALCVLASYEQLQQADEPSLLASYVPAKGLERLGVAYDALSDVDTDGDGDPHTTRTADLVPRDQVVVPEIDDLVRAMRHCKGTVCTSDDREFRFGLKAIGADLQLYRLEIVERPPCAPPK
ncbi:MAG TPA: hypothetical protein VFQ53_10475 [Kofleriaceae bacterium]|nr:hypothetical protein [Kofleriaceae bacterium]